MTSVGLVAVAAVLIGFGVLYITTFKFIAWLMLILIVVSLLFIIRQPRFLFEKRLNHFFVLFTYPFSKWNNIYQQPVKSMRFRNTGSAICRNHYRSYTQEMVSAFDFIDREHGYYRTITHETLKDRLLHIQEQGKIEILACEPAYQRSLIHIQKYLFFNRCKKCSDAGQCYFRRLSDQPRQFYYIEFRIL